MSLTFQVGDHSFVFVLELLQALGLLLLLSQVGGELGDPLLQMLLLLNTGREWSGWDAHDLVLITSKLFGIYRVNHSCMTHESLFKIMTLIIESIDVHGISWISRHYFRTSN